MSRSKRKKLEKNISEENIEEEAELNSEVEPPKKPGSIRGVWATDQVRAAGEEAEKRKEEERGESPPLPMALSVVMIVGFGGALSLRGFSAQFSGKGISHVLSTAFLLVGFSLVFTGMRLYKRAYWAWILSLGFLGTFVALFLFSAVVYATLIPIFAAVVFLIPLMMLLLPGTRESLREERKSE